MVSMIANSTVPSSQRRREEYVNGHSEGAIFASESDHDVIADEYHAVGIRLIGDGHPNWAAGYRRALLEALYPELVR